MSEISERFERVARGFTATVEAVPDGAWERPAPCEGWTGRDVVRHLVDWLPGPGFLLGTFDVETGPIPSVEDDPAAAWAVVRDAVQRALDDPEVAARVADCGPPGRMSLEAAVDMTCTPDVLVHTWDLARATGLDERLDPDEVRRQVAAVEALPPEVDEAMRRSGHYGPRVEVDDDADAQTRLLAFMGRTA
ncbi:TIGR03086 family metal-binding protein [Actinomarinicola tropica]|uniref:TIGR03086 family protein n=1 Tax=Actinomarinicola tropica TaxID=2789776 RepID=A0A5Q2RNW1_9ACTN|nr:TIGR03086 family metal-binding protein [Actinomarinicola tropica]QGG96116.1 TIGR03086 family protein [Actinomarinicola tropica]